jgi:hypothetical protein
MNGKNPTGIFSKFTSRNNVSAKQMKKGKRVIAITISKRQKFVVGVVALSAGLFIAGINQVGEYALHVALTLAVLTDFFLVWGIYKDLRESFAGSVLILPFFYSFAFGLFYFLVPSQILFRIILCIIYAFGLYSLFLVQNIFTVASVRTIALLQGARIVSIIITMLSYFFLSNIVFSLHLSMLPMLGLIALFTYLLAYQSIRTYALQNTSEESLPLWVAGLTVCLLESAAILWFWPSSPTIIAIFLAGFFYTLVGLSHMWYERRLFRGVLWEYLWVGVIVFFMLMVFTPWGK